MTVKCAQQRAHRINEGRAAELLAFHITFKYQLLKNSSSSDIMEENKEKDGHYEKTE